MARLYLIDGHAYIHRAYHALPPLNNSRGEPVNAIYGLLRMLLKIIRQEKPDYIAVCFDTAAPTFRHKIYSDYKGTRKEADPALIAQFPMAREAVKALNLASFELDGYEADDLLAHLTREARIRNLEVVIVSGDKDALQLVGEGVSVLNEPKNMMMRREEVRARWSVEPRQIPDLFALIGDTSDNIPGIRGIGEKTATKLIQEYGSLENLLNSAGTLKGKTSQLLLAGADSARRSRELVRLHHEVPLAINWDALALHQPKTEVLSPFLQRMEFFSLLNDLLPQWDSASALETRNYKTISSEDSLKACVEKAVSEDRLAITVETAGTDPVKAAIVGIGISFAPNSAFYIPVAHSGLAFGGQLSIDTVRQLLGPLLIKNKPAVYGHNLKFDLIALKRHGMPVSIAGDTMIASYVLNPSRNSHDLKDLVLEILNERMTSLEQLLGKGSKQISMDQAPVEQAAAFSCANADMTLRLAEKLEAQIKEKNLGKLYYEMELPLVPVLAEMEEAGIRIDRTYLNNLGKDFKERCRLLEQKIFAIAGETFNINSPKQLSVILFEKLKLPVIRRTKTGISTDEEVLRTLAASHELPMTLIEYRELQKMLSTYAEGLQAGLTDGAERIHTNFNQAVTATGRLSSSNPNLQNIPIRSEIGRQIRRAFVPDEGAVFLSADYSQIDLRMLAHISQDPTLCEAFRKGEDIHVKTACEIFGIHPCDMTPDYRRIAKSINFGIVYGISAYGLSQQLQISPEEARGHIDRYFERYPGVRTWIDATLKDARGKGYVTTLLGRIRYLPEIMSKNSAIRGFAERTAMNTPIQGTSADIIKLAMIHLDKAGRDNLWDGRMLVQVHDELLFEVPQSSLKATAAKVKDLMENALSLSIPVVVDLKTGSNWADMSTYKI
jgi:DNA polymerase-1